MTTEPEQSESQRALIGMAIHMLRGIMHLTPQETGQADAGLQYIKDCDETGALQWHNAAADYMRVYLHDIMKNKRMPSRIALRNPPTEQAQRVIEALEEFAKEKQLEYPAFSSRFIAVDSAVKKEAETLLKALNGAELPDLYATPPMGDEFGTANKIPDRSVAKNPSSDGKPI